MIGLLRSRRWRLLRPCLCRMEVISASEFALTDVWLVKGGVRSDDTSEGSRDSHVSLYRCEERATQFLSLALLKASPHCAEEWIVFTAADWKHENFNVSFSHQADRADYCGHLSGIHPEPSERHLGEWVLRLWLDGSRRRDAHRAAWELERGP